MTTKEMNSMDGRLNATQLHIEELDREIATIRMERLLRAAAPDGPGLPRRALAGVGRRLIQVGVAFVGETQARSGQTARTNGPI